MSLNSVFHEKMAKNGVFGGGGFNGSGGVFIYGAE